MATLPAVPDEKDTTKVSFAESIITALGELSAEVAGGISQLKNGSFEDISSGEAILWTVTDSAGGSHAISDATDSGGEAHHGQRSLQIVSTGGGGFAEALSDEFLPVGAGNTILVAGFIRRDTAGIRKRAQILYYNVNQSLIATDTVYDNSGTATTYELVGGMSGVPNNAFFYRIKLIGAEAGGTIAGNSFFDGFAASILLRPPTLLPTIYSSAGTGTYTVPSGVYAIHITCGGGGGEGGNAEVIGGPGGGGGSGFIEGVTVSVTPGDVLPITVGASGSGSGASGTKGGDGGVTWVSAPGGNFNNRYVNANGGNGGIGGTAGGAGGTGWNNGVAAVPPVGGDGADHVYGTQGAGGTSGNPGGDASGNCAGGGGGGGSAGVGSGGDGADGYIIITPSLM